MRKKRVRMHYLDPQHPSVEGLLLRRWPEYVVGVPQLLIAAGQNPAVLEDARHIAIPRHNIAFYERLR